MSEFLATLAMLAAAKVVTCCASHAASVAEMPMS